MLCFARAGERKAIAGERDGANTLRNRLNEYRYYWVLALPAILELLLTTFAQYVDMAMVGKIGADASAAVGLTTPLIWLVNAPQYALGLALQSYVAFNIGKNDRQQTAELADKALVLTLILGLGEGLLFCLAAPFIPGWMGADTAIQGVAGRYFLIISIPMLFRTADVVFGSMLRGTRDMKTPMRINFLMNLANIVLNFLLIYPTRNRTILGLSVVLPGAGMGVVGAGIATAVAYVIGGVLMFLAIKRNSYLKSIKTRKTFSFRDTKDVLRKALPIALNRVGVSLGHVAFTGLVTGLGTIPLAAHSIALTAEEVFYVPGYGMQSVASTLTGNALGENDQVKLRKNAENLLILSVLVLGLLCVLLFFGAEWVMGLFTPDAAVRVLGAKVLRIVSVSEPIFAVFIILEGVFNGAGYTEKPFYIGILCMWGIRILGTYLCVHVFHLGLQAVWAMMVADNVIRAVLLVVLYRRGNWTGELG